MLKLQGEHCFEEGTLSVSAAGSLVKQLQLKTTQGTERFSAQIPVRPGDRLISVTLQEAGGGTERQYIEGSFRAGQTRTLEVSLSGWRGLGRRGSLRLRRVD